jgi:hypothetical protein
MLDPNAKSTFHSARKLGGLTGTTPTNGQLSRLANVLCDPQAREQVGARFQGKSPSNRGMAPCETWKINVAWLLGVDLDVVCVVNPDQRRVITVYETTGLPRRDGRRRASYRTSKPKPHQVRHMT